MICSEFKNFAFLTATLLGLSCSHAPPLQEYTATANPTEEFQKLDADMTSAYRDQVDILAPANYEKAKSSFEEAKVDIDKQRDSSKILHKIATSRSYLNQAVSLSQVSHANIEDVISARRQAIAAGAPKHYDKEFMTADRQLRKVTLDLEQNDLDSAAKNHTQLQGAYLDLELLSIKKENLHVANELIEQAIGEGAKRLAPRSLAIAVKNYKDTEAYITANRHDSQVQVKSQESTALATHLLKITRSAKTTKKTSPEELALSNESVLLKVTDKENEIQTKDVALANQNSQLAKKDSEIAQNESALENQNAQLNSAALALTDSHSKANAEKEFNQKYDTARAEFNENEAEVYKQGDSLVIRLKAIEFAKSKANLKASNFSLLAKVEKVIKSFGPSSLIIEGHTDSVGGKAVNEKISTDRAQAIREYFIANSVAEPAHITAVGYDYQKPIATNKTSVGRAQNRRVDIRIQPDKNTSL